MSASSLLLNSRMEMEENEANPVISSHSPVEIPSLLQLSFSNIVLLVVIMGLSLKYPSLFFIGTKIIPKLSCVLSHAT